MTARHRLLPTFTEAETIWKKLEAAAPTSPFQSFAWLSEWYRCIGEAEGVSLALVLVEGPDNTPWMLLPMGIHRGGLGRVLSWLGGELSDYLGPLIGPECPDSTLGDEFPALWRAITKVLPAFSYAHLERQPERISGRKNPFSRLDWRENPSRSHQTVLGPDWKAYYHSKSSARTRQTDRRKQRRLEDAGVIRFEVVGAGQAADVLRVLFAQKSQSYRELGVDDLFANARYREFLEGVTRASNREGQGPEGGKPLVHLSCLWVGHRIVATHFGLVHQGRFYCLLPTYERSELTPHSPGALLRLRLLQWACENGMLEFDFTVGDEPYKDRWCEVSVPLYDGLVGASTWGRACTAALRAGSALKRELKASPEIYPVLVRLRALGLGRATGETVRSTE